MKGSISQTWLRFVAAKGASGLNQRPSLLLFLPNFKVACQNHAALRALQRKGHQISL